MGFRGATSGGVGNVAALLGIGVILLSVGGYLLTNEGRVQGDAVPTDGVVVESGVEREGAGGYLPVVEYEYTYEGTTYAGDRVYAEKRRPTTRERAREVADRYPAGSGVTVYVDADDPSRSHLIRDPPSPLYHLFLAGGLLTILLGGGLLFEHLFRVAGGR